MTSIPETLIAARLKVQLFDMAAEITSDSPTYLAPFAAMFSRFQVPENTPIDKDSLKISLLTRAKDPWAGPVLIIGEEVIPLEEQWLHGGYPYDLIRNALLKEVGSHILIHAGAVSWNGDGLLLCGDSGHGKTTLVLELVERGFGFLSDDVAPLGLEEGWIYPFPRSLNIRPETLALMGHTDKILQAPRWEGNLLPDIDLVHPGSLSRKVPLKVVILLGDPTEPLTGSVEAAIRPLGMLVDKAEEPFLECIRQIREVKRMRTETDRGYPLVRVWTEHRPAVQKEIETIASQHGVRVLDVIKRPANSPIFSDRATLEEIPESQAIMELMRRFQGGHHSRLMKETFNGSATRLFLGLTQLVGEASFYRLSPGPLPQMADLVSGIVGK